MYGGSLPQSMLISSDPKAHRSPSAQRDKISAHYRPWLIIFSIWVCAVVSLIKAFLGSSDSLGVFWGIGLFIIGTTNKSLIISCLVGERRHAKYVEKLIEDGKAVRVPMDLWMLFRHVARQHDVPDIEHGSFAASFIVELDILSKAEWWALEQIEVVDGDEKSNEQRKQALALVNKRLEGMIADELASRIDEAQVALVEVHDRNQAILRTFE